MSLFRSPRQFLEAAVQCLCTALASVDPPISCPCQVVYGFDGGDSSLNCCDCGSLFASDNGLSFDGTCDTGNEATLSWSLTVRRCYTKLDVDGGMANGGLPTSAEQSAEMQAFEQEAWFAFQSLKCCMDVQWGGNNTISGAGLVNNLQLSRGNGCMSYTISGTINLLMCCPPVFDPPLPPNLQPPAPVPPQ